MTVRLTRGETNSVGRRERSLQSFGAAQRALLDGAGSLERRAEGMIPDERLAAATIR